MFFDFKSRGTFTNRLSKKEKLCFKKRNYLKKKKTCTVWESLQKKWLFFVREFRNTALKPHSRPKTTILAKESLDFSARIVGSVRML